MTKLKPLAFIRKQLQIKGKSLHSGRGSYYCLSNKSNVDMYNTAQEKLKHWHQQGLIESVQVDDGCKLGFVLSRNTFEGNYRYIEFDKMNNLTNKQGVNKFYCGMVY